MEKIIFDFAKDKEKELNQLLLDSGLDNKKDLLNNALTLLNYALKERKNGRVFGSLSKNNEFKEVVLPIFK